MRGRVWLAALILGAIVVAGCAPQASNAPPAPPKKANTSSTTTN